MDCFFYLNMLEKPRKTTTTVECIRYSRHDLINWYEKKTDNLQTIITHFERSVITVYVQYTWIWYRISIGAINRCEHICFNNVYKRRFLFNRRNHLPVNLHFYFLLVFTLWCDCCMRPCLIFKLWVFKFLSKRNSALLIQWTTDSFN